MVADTIAVFLRAIADRTAEPQSLELTGVHAQGDTVWALVSLEADGERWRCEVPASAFLPTSRPLTSAQGSELRRRGFSKPRTSRNFVREMPRASVEADELARELVEILTQVYAVGPESLAASLVPDDRDRTENPALLAAMTAVASAPGDATRRHELYTELVNATYLVPLGEDGELFVFDRIEDRPVLGAFTDRTSLRCWNPRAGAHREIHGAVLFPAVEARGPALFEINREGPVGGRLYAHEVEALVRAIRHFRATRLH